MKRNKLLVPGSSKLPIITAICAAAIFLFNILHLSIDNGVLDYRFYLSIDLYSLCESFSALTLLITALFVKKNINLFVIPALLKTLMALFMSYLMLGFIHIKIDTGILIEIILSALLILFLLGGIKNKKIVLSAVFAMIIFLTVSFVKGWGNLSYQSSYSSYYNVSAFAAIILFYLGYVVLILAANNTSGKANTYKKYKKDKQSTLSKA